MNSYILKMHLNGVVLVSFKVRVANVVHPVMKSK